MIDELSQMVKMFEESEDATRESRALAERDRDYYDNKQWTSEEASELKKRKQPVVTYNRIQRKVNSLLGLEKQTRKDPKAFPRNPQDEAAAHAATDSIRYVCDDSRWDDRRSSAAENLIIEGTAAIMVGVKQTKQGIDPDIRRIAWDRHFADPHSNEFDFSDAAYQGIVIWGDLDDLKRKYPEGAEALEVTWNTAAKSDTYDDRPKHALWADHKRKRVRVVEMYYIRDGQWKLCIFTQGGFLVEPMTSPYLDDDGQPECPIKAVSLYIDRDNNRYGEVRTMIGPQDEVNKRRSKALHLINERQVRVSPSVGMSADQIRKELSNPRGVFVGDKDDVEILPTNDMAMANLQLLQEAKNEIDLLGPNAALQGKNQQEQSGRAILAQQQGGMIEAATMLDRIRCLSLAVYRSAWARIQQHWSGERWIRVTDNDKNMRFVGLNRPVTGMEMVARKFGVSQDNFAEFQSQAPEQAAQLMAFSNTPMAQAVMSVENAVAELDVDISIDEGIDTPTIAAEEFTALLQAASTGAIPIPPDVLIEASSFRNKDKLLDMMKQQQQGPPPEVVEAQRAMQEAAMADAKANTEETQSKTMLNIAKAHSEAAKPMIDSFRAGQAPPPM